MHFGYVTKHGRFKGAFQRAVVDGFDGNAGGHVTEFLFLILLIQPKRQDGKTDKTDGTDLNGFFFRLRRKLFQPQRHEGTKLAESKTISSWLCAFVANCIPIAPKA
jgi:hypothetical protein